MKIDHRVCEIFFYNTYSSKVVNIFFSFVTWCNFQYLLKWEQILFFLRERGDLNMYLVACLHSQFPKNEFLWFRSDHIYFSTLFVFQECRKNEIKHNCSEFQGGNHPRTHWILRVARKFVSYLNFFKFYYGSFFSI